MKKIALLSILLSPVIFFSCRKVAPSLKVKSSLFPLQEGNYWKYNFYHRETDSTYSTYSNNAEAAEIRIGSETRLPDGRDAILMIVTIAQKTDTQYIVNDNTDLVFFKLYANEPTEMFRLKESLAKGQQWVNDKDTTTVLDFTSITVPAGRFTTYKIHRATQFPQCSCLWLSIKDNYYWIKKGTGFVKLNLYIFYPGFKHDPVFYNYGIYELVEYKIN